MPLMSSELYDALLEAGASEEKARKSAEAVAAYETRFARIESDLTYIPRLFRIVISVSMHADLRMVSHESALFSRGCTPTSLWGCTLSGHCEGVCTTDIMVCALVRGSPRDIRRDSKLAKH